MQHQLERSWPVVEEVDDSSATAATRGSPSTVLPALATPDTAILVVTYNAARYLPDLFASLAAHTDLARIPIIVVDNASTDGTLEALDELTTRLPRLEVLAQARNTGFAGGNNIALRRARELGVRFSVLLNHDTVVTDGWLDRLVAVMKMRPDVAAAQPLLMLFDEPERINSAGNLVHFCGFSYCGGYRKRPADLDLGDTVRPVCYATGAALLLRMAALDEVGDLDETMFLYLEECDLQLRLRQVGYECVLVPTSRVLHKYTATFSAQKYGWLERNRWILVAKNWPLARLAVLAPALVGVELAVLVFAARNGWLPEKLQGYVDFIATLPATVRARRRVSAARSSADDAMHLTGALEFDGFDHPIITRVANPLLSAYWRVASRLLKAIGQ